MKRMGVIGSMVAIAGLAWPAAASAQSVCEAPRVLLTVDKSSSMLGELPGGLTKWEAARMAIGELASGYADSIDFGLQPFPYPNRCEPGSVQIEVGPHSAEEIVGGLGDPPPTGGNYTPMAQTLDVAGEYAPMTEAGRDNHLILLTDGWQWCDPYDPDTRFDPVDAVGRLNDAGITAHVVGFGAAVDSLTLNRAAVAAGTALPGCDESADAPSDPNHCYMQADDLSELRTVLDDIGRSITEELCDGFDNDCDGMIDEGYDTDADGVTTCDGDCDDSDDTVYPDATELCDGVDNDCDGSTDTGCACTNGDTQECGSEIGACEKGEQVCTDGMWGACEGGTGPEDADLCDGIDGDCDGDVDEDADCGEGHSCHEGMCVADEPDEPTRPMEPPPEKGGCGCAATSPQGTAGGALLLGLAALGLIARRRRR